MVRNRLAVAAMLAVALLVPAGCASRGPMDEGGVSASPSPSPSESVPLEDVSGIEGVLTIPAEPFADWVTATEGGVWVANVGPGIVRYADDGTVTASVPTGSVDLAMEQGFGSLWAGADAGPDAGELVRVDLASPENVVRIPVPPLAEESSIAVTDDAVWLLTAEGELVRVDAASNAVTGTSPAPGGAFALRGGFGSLWITLRNESQVARVDPATLEVIAAVDVGSGASFLAVGTDAIWVMNQADGSVSRVDPEEERTTATVENLGSIPGGDIAASEDAVWVRTSRDLAVEIDPVTNAVVRRLGPPQGSGSIDIAADGAVWISAHDVNKVHRIP